MADLTLDIPPRPKFESSSSDIPGENKSPGDESVFQDEDEDHAQAVLQPAMSAAASHFTSAQTPAVEKAAALEKRAGDGFFLFSHIDSDSAPLETDADGESTPELTSPDRTPRTQSSGFGPSLGALPSRQLPATARQTLPSPWESGPKDMVVGGPRSSETRGLLGTAFGSPGMRSRSRSTGQEALRKLQRAFPSISTPTHLLSSSIFGPFMEKSTNGNSPRQPRTASSGTLVEDGVSTSGVSRQTRARAESSVHPSTRQLQRSGTSFLLPQNSDPTRPPMLRRVTSDDSLLYHSLSRTSSLGDDDRFHDVREMVNMRLMALKDSLPEVPNFRLPTLAKMQDFSKRSSMSLNGIFSNDSAPDSPGRGLPEMDPAPSSSFGEDWSDFDKVIEELTGDVVVLGGYRGSILRSAEPPHQQVWAPVKLGFNMRKVNLEVGLDHEDEENMEETIIPSGMLKHIGPIDVSKKLFKKLRSTENAKTGKLRVWDYGYDWRLSPRLLCRKMREFLRQLPSNQPGVSPESRGALVIAHSLGGFITRHAVNQEPNLFSGVLFAGTPQRCVNILGPLRNGDVVLFNESLLSAAVNFSIRTSFVFLPEDGYCFIDKSTGEEYPVDFYNPDDWVKWRLSPCIEPSLPAFNRPHSSSFSALLPPSLRPRSDSKAEKRPPFADLAGSKDRTIAPQLNPGTSPPVAESLSSSTRPSESDRQRNLEYLTRVLADTKQFRAENTHSPKLESDNAYPPFAVLYGKTIPTVYAAGVNGRDAIPCADAYDDLLFRSGDGVVLAKEAMLPEGYSMVRGGRVSTERGHITMLGDMPAMGRAIGALIRGRRKGIGLGHGSKGQVAT